ncbi:Predicted ATPase [Sinomicrobium oceani]|uniref:Predicted ATPase n=1 Tax=Sinomicrobium oceani TaxID=1150368 RepID=A0A1K1RS15_9FLAO|nr:AAA family ATPase [Sinomicrobium oceani]SFW74535.1 Predicted ATPase [Sinomicrobium oceani]
MKNKSSTIIITGGPGMGKTSVLEQLSIMGYHSVEETGRSIIQKELKTDGNRLPWLDKEGFAMAMFQQSLKDFQNVSEKSGLTFFDRGIPDVIGYLKLCNISIPETMWQAAEEKRYYPKVFITPPWKSIYVNDAERKQTFEEAVATYHIMKETYSFLGYELVELPKTTVLKRAKFILNYLLTY